MDERLARRIRAAAQLGGYKSDRALAEAIGVHEDTLASRLNGSKQLTGPEWAAIVRVCAVPEAFYSADLDRLDELPPALAERLAALDGKVGELLTTYLEDRAEDRLRSARVPPSGEAAGPRSGRRGK